MEFEINFIRENRTWDLVELLSNQWALMCRWMFRLKQTFNYNSLKYKARIVTKVSDENMELTLTKYCHRGKDDYPLVSPRRYCGKDDYPLVSPRRLLRRWSYLNSTSKRCFSSVIWIRKYTCSNPKASSHLAKHI